MQAKVPSDNMDMHVIASSIIGGVPGAFGTEADSAHSFAGNPLMSC